MPFTWSAFSTASVPEITELRDDPLRLKDSVRQIVEAEGATLVELYFDIGREVAYALIKDFPNSPAAKRATRNLGSSELTKLLDAQQMDAALRGG